MTTASYVAFLTTWLAAGVRLSGPLLLAALGEIYAERSGVVNIGLEGAILIGALTSYLVAVATGSPTLGVVSAVIAAGIAGLFLAFFYVIVQANQVVIGVVFNIFALGLCSVIYRAIAGDTPKFTVAPISKSFPSPPSMLSRP